MNADKYGWIKKSWLTNDSNQVSDICLLDGIQNVLPSGIDKLTQNAFSTLVDGYKKTELVGNSPLALFRMEAILVDRAEPSESLRANSVWSYGFDNAAYLLSSVQLYKFRKVNSFQQEKEERSEGCILCFKHFLKSSTNQGLVLCCRGASDVSKWLTA
jgi:hypothetical protein